MPEHAAPSDRSNASAEDARSPVADVLRELRVIASDLRYHASDSMVARVDLARASVRRASLLAVIGFACLIIACGIAVGAAVAVMIGLATLVGDLLSASSATGLVIVGSAILIAGALAAYAGVRRLQRRWFEATRARYRDRDEQRQSDVEADADDKRSGESTPTPART